MKLLVTGGAGFIGSAVVRLAVARGHRVVNLDALTYAANLANVAPVADSPLYAFLAGRYPRPRGAGCGFCHAPARYRDAFGGRIPCRPLYRWARRFYRHQYHRHVQHAGGGAQILAGAGRPDGFRFHHISTDEVFGSLPADPAVQFTEATAYDPRSPYSASKAASDHLVRAWFETYGLPVVLSNCSNNYGPYHFPEKLIPVVILNALAGRALPIYGDGSNIRDWLYVEDHADALLLVATKGALGRSYNIGGENERTNLQLVQTICAILDRLRPRDTGATPI